MWLVLHLGISIKVNTYFQGFRQWQYKTNLREGKHRRGDPTPPSFPPGVCQGKCSHSIRGGWGQAEPSSTPGSGDRDLSEGSAPNAEEQAHQVPTKGTSGLCCLEQISPKNHLQNFDFFSYAIYFLTLFLFFSYSV